MTIGHAAGLFIIISILYLLLLLCSSEDSANSRPSGNLLPTVVSQFGTWRHSDARVVFLPLVS